MFTRTIVLNFNTYEMTPGFNPVTKESELNRPWTSHFSFYFRVSFDWNMTVSAKFRLACVATVSNRVTARKLERQRKKHKVEVGGRGEKRKFFKIVEFAGKRFLLSPPPPPSFLYFFAVVPTFLGELARKRLLRRLSSAVSIPVSKGGAVSSFCVRNLSRIPLLCCLTLPLQVCIE